MGRFVLLALTGSSMLLSASLLAQTVSAPAATRPTSVSTTAEPKVRCKRYVETGSLAKVRKECHTEAEWRSYAEAGREGARAMVNNTYATGQGPQ